MIFNKNINGYIFRTSGRNVNENRTAVYDYFLPIIDMGCDDLGDVGMFSQAFRNNTNKNILVCVFDADGNCVDHNIIPTFNANPEQSEYSFTFEYNKSDITLYAIAFGILDENGDLDSKPDQVYYVKHMVDGIYENEPCIDKSYNPIKKDTDGNYYLEDWLWGSSNGYIPVKQDEIDVIEINTIEKVRSDFEPFDLIFVNNYGTTITIYLDNGEQSITIEPGATDSFTSLGYDSVISFGGQFTDNEVHVYYEPYANANPDVPYTMDIYTPNNENDAHYIYSLKTFKPISGNLILDHDITK